MNIAEKTRIGLQRCVVNERTQVFADRIVANMLALETGPKSHPDDPEILQLTARLIDRFEIERQQVVASLREPLMASDRAYVLRCPFCGNVPKRAESDTAVRFECADLSCPVVVYADGKDEREAALRWNLRRG